MVPRSAGGSASRGRAPARGAIANPGDGAPGLSPESALTITALNTAIKDALEGMLPTIWVSGEVSAFKTHQNGHWYITLKDTDGSALDCVVWGGDKARFPVEPEIGMRVFAKGEITVWAKVNRIQFRIRAIEDQGEGIWRKAFEKTKAALERDGLLDPARKRPIPRFPRTVAVITSPSGAALHDIVSVIARRNPTIDIVVIPAAVQGDSAPASLVAALRRAADWNGADVVIIGRGGGSREDLWCFNDEQVARAIAASPVPVISAVGHEVDVSISDFVADVRAATPSAAAELVAPALADILADLQAYVDGMRGAIVRRALDARRDLAAVQGAVRSAASRRLLDARRDLGAARLAIRGGAQHRFLAARHRLVARAESVRARGPRVAERGAQRIAVVAGRLHALSPLAILARGYAVPRTPAGAALPRAADFRPEMPFSLRLHDGEVNAVTSAVRAGNTK